MEYCKIDKSMYRENLNPKRKYEQILILKALKYFNLELVLLDISMKLIFQFDIDIWRRQD